MDQSISGYFQRQAEAAEARESVGDEYEAGREEGHGDAASRITGLLALVERGERDEVGALDLFDSLRTRLERLAAELADPGFTPAPANDYLTPYEN